MTLRDPDSVRPAERLSVGVLMLDTRFPRPPGDIGNPLSFTARGFDVRYQIVRGASARRVVEQRDPALLEPFIEAGLRLCRDGVRRIGTSCGFLASFQHELASALPVPVISSALLACAKVPGPGILTFSEAALDRQLLAAAGVPGGTPVRGVDPDGEFHRAIVEDRAEMDLSMAQSEVVAAAQSLVADHPEVRTLVLECTNMPPYRRAIEQATGRPTIDLLRLLTAPLER